MKIRIQRTWYGYKAWDPQDKVAAWDSPRCVRTVSWGKEHDFKRWLIGADARDRAIEKARIKFGPKDPKWEEVDV